MNKLASQIDSLNKHLIGSLHTSYPFGLAHGKMGLLIYLYHLYDYTQEAIYKEKAERLLDDLLENDLSKNAELTVEEGLCGVALGLDYIVKKQFVDGDINDLLSGIDDLLFKKLVFGNMESRYSLSQLIHFLYYIYKRLEIQTNDNERFPFEGLAIKLVNQLADLIDASFFEELGQQNLYNYRGLATSHPQFGQIAATGGKGISMPYAIKPAGYSEQQIIDMYGSVEAWEKSYVDDGSSSWARSAYYQMLADGYSDAEARKGTNWYDEIVQTGKIQDHQISLVGGGEKATYSVSLGYTNREGTIQNSYFKRYSLRTNTTYNPNKYFTMGQNTNLAAMETGGESGRQGDANTFAKTYTMNSWVPIYNVGGDYTGSVAPNAGRDISAVHQVAMNENDWTRMFHGQTAVFAELSNPWIEGLKLRSQFSARLNGMWSLEMTERQNMANKEASANNTLTETGNWRLNWQWTNTATYTKKIHEDHNITVVLGTEAIKQGVGRYMQGTRIDYIFESDPNTWTLDNGSSSNIGNSSRYQRKVTMFGLFGRADYSYKGKYLATFTIRRDASSKFGSKNRWGNFPSASLGWRMSDEKFMEPTRKWLDDFKLRAGYGTTGNSNIGSYNYAFQYGTGNYYMYPITGSDSETSPGYVLSNLGDSDAKW